MAAPSAATDTGIISLRDLIDFISHVADCYPDILKDFPQQLIDMLLQHHLVLEPELREKIVGSLVLLRKKDIMDSATYGISDRTFRITMLTRSSTDCSTPYSRSSSRRRARLYGRCCSRKSFLNSALRTRRLSTTSSTGPCRPYYSILSHRTVHLRRVFGQSS